MEPLIQMAFARPSTKGIFVSQGNERVDVGLGDEKLELCNKALKAMFPETEEAQCVSLSLYPEEHEDGHVFYAKKVKLG